MTRWYIEKKKEHFYKEAKRVGYRARSAFKLKQIQNKFKILNIGDIVIDLGAAPGGWSQVAKEIVGKKGKIIGVDILPIKPINEIEFIQGDITDKNTIQIIKQKMGNRKADVIISDIAPDISGNYSIDHARSIWLCEKALDTAKTLLKHGGNFVCKLFDGEDTKKIIQQIEQCFSSVKRFTPQASRKRSSEIYIIAKSFIKK
ncbi:MAG: 23S rRNA (uridine(2552)-2'-O)-methyltransferase [Thermoplasmata archaeon]|nr:MAG: 23S rRNA (uridine(2552)-2'-O)-methyltransferase [Thermoplasmata archaeon]